MLRRKPKHLCIQCTHQGMPRPADASRTSFATAQHDGYKLRLSADQIFCKNNQRLFF